MTDLFVIRECGSMNKFSSRSKLLVLAHTPYFRSYNWLVLFGKSRTTSLRFQQRVFLNGRSTKYQNNPCGGTQHLRER